MSSGDSIYSQEIRFKTREHEQDPLRATASVPLVSSRSPVRPFGRALKGGLLLHLGGLVPGCCTSGACTGSVTAGADGAATAGPGSQRVDSGFFSTDTPTMLSTWYLAVSTAESLSSRVVLLSTNMSLQLNSFGSKYSLAI